MSRGTLDAGREATLHGSQPQLTWNAVLSALSQVAPASLTNKEITSRISASCKSDVSQLTLLMFKAGAINRNIETGKGAPTRYFIEI